MAVSPELEQIQKLIEGNDLYKARDVFQASPVSGEAAVEKAQLALRLVVAFRKRGLLEDAKSIYDSMDNLGDSEEVVSIRGRVAFNLFESYRKANLLDKTFMILQEMEHLLATEDVLLLRGLAA
ncbi:MAG: hypothetical protein LBF22_07900, partial [Deltaproteobacteria bacterium]|nr:hypothetical protein [Deltaproteobacteria bacterium]